MPRQQTVQTLRVFVERDLAAPEAIDYDADYRALDLMPGAPLRDIEDRARLLHAAFHPPRLPAGLKARAEARTQMIDRAVDELSRYWQTHGAPPPTAEMRPGPPGDPLDTPDDFFAALADALGTGAAGAPEGATGDRRTRPAAALREIAGGLSPRQFGVTPDRGDPIGRGEETDSGQTIVIPGWLGRADPESRNIGFSEHSESRVHGFPARGLRSRPGMTLPQNPEGRGRPVTIFHPPVSAQPAPLPRATPPAPSRPLPDAAVRVAAAPRDPPAPGHEPTSDRQSRRPLSIARAVVVKLAIAGLVIAAALRLMQYRADLPSLPAIATGWPGDPPARWSGLSGHQPTGAAAPSIAGHQR